MKLARALIGGEKDVFRGEDPKYLTFIEGVLDPPPEGRDQYRGTFERGD
jgi:hypothetical protein